MSGQMCNTFNISANTLGSKFPLSPIFKYPASFVCLLINHSCYVSSANPVVSFYAPLPKSPWLFYHILVIPFPV